jgi:hypothetical protein
MDPKVALEGESRAKIETARVLAFVASTLVFTGCGRTEQTSNSDVDAADVATNVSPDESPVNDVNSSEDGEASSGECMPGVVALTPGCPCMRGCGGDCSATQEGMVCWYQDDCARGLGNVYECVCQHDTSFESPHPYWWGGPESKLFDCPPDGGIFDTAGK